jgi:hypothetical protein
MSKVERIAMGYEDRSQHDLHAQLAISREEAIHGTTRMLTLPEGQQLTVPIPAGVHSGQIIRIIGQGLPSQGSSTTGDLILTIVLVAPSDTHPHFIDQPASPQASIHAKSFPEGHFPSTQPSSSRGMHKPTDSLDHLISQQYASYATPFPSSNYSSSIVGKQQPGNSRARQRSNGFFFACLSMTCVVILISLFLYYTNSYLPMQRALHATATAAVYTTAVAQANATLIAQTQGTATANPYSANTIASAHQSQYLHILKSTPVLSDPLNAPDANGWDRGQGCAFQNGAYQVTEASTGVFLYCTAEATHFNNFAYQVRMTIHKGDFGGITFRENKTKPSFYLFRVGKNGSYNIYYYANNAGKDSLQLLTGTSNLIHTGTMQTNTLAVVARDTMLDLYINGGYLNSVYSKDQLSGQIGVIADDTTNVAQVAYTQAQVWAL